jgi:hypothetical protein
MRLVLRGGPLRPGALARFAVAAAETLGAREEGFRHRG